MKTNPKMQTAAAVPFFPLHLDAGFFGRAVLLLAVAGAAIYANSLRCAFQFDDGYAIVENFRLRNIFDFQAIWSLDQARFLTYLSFALNYHFGGLNVVAYHATNIFIHIVTGIFVFLLTWLTTRTPFLKQQWTPEDSREIALFSGLIFLCHPVQTQAVTYIVQRAASLAAFFYVGTMLCYAMARLTHDFRWYVTAFLTCLASMFTKQIAFTLPLMILLYDFTFFDTRARIKNSPLLWFAPFLITLVIIPFLTFSGKGAAVQVEGLPTVAGSVSRVHYLLTQFNVIRTYLRLLFFPVHQALEYDYPVATTFAEPHTFISFLLLAGILSFAFGILRRQRLAAFGIFWFFIALSVESSVIPITHVIFEHRLYLPLAGFAIAMAAGAYTVIRSKLFFRVAMFVAIFVLCVLTVMRNPVWESRLSLWQDNVKKSPKLGSAHYSLGLAYAELGRTQEALSEYQLALDEGYKTGRVYDDMARIYEKSNELEKAIYYYELGVAADPTFAPAFSNLGALWLRMKRYDRALLMTQKAFTLDPGNIQILANLGGIYASLGRYNEAIGVLTIALQIDPNFESAKRNLALLYQKMQARENERATRVV